MIALGNGGADTEAIPLILLDPLSPEHPESYLLAEA
jgi:hypothetical protein